MAKFDPMAWLTLDEELLGLVVETSGKHKKTLLLTNRRLVLIQSTGGNWKFIEDKLWKEFDSVSVEHQSWSKSFLSIHFNSKSKSEDGLWDFYKVKTQPVIPAYQLLKERELKRRETPPKKPDPAKKDLPHDSRFVFNIDSKECKAEEMMNKEKKSEIPILPEKAAPANEADAGKDKKEDSSATEEKKEEAKDETQQAGDNKDKEGAVSEQELHKEGKEALKEGALGFIKNLFKKN